VRRRPTSWGTALVAIAAAVAIFVVGSVFTLSEGWRGLWVVFQISLLAAIVGAASWPPDREAAEPWRSRVLGPAWLALIVVGTIVTFDDMWRTVTITERASRNVSVNLTAGVAVACASLASLLAIRLAGMGRWAAAVACSAAFLIVTLHGLAMLGMNLPGWIVFNLWLLVLGVLTLMEGIRTQALGKANLGLLAVSALVVARFFDTELSFLARGLVFVGFGVACLSLNVWMMRRAGRRAA
jgi:hypothetical protein